MLRTLFIYLLFFGGTLVAEEADAYFCPNHFEKYFYKTSAENICRIYPYLELIPKTYASTCYDCKNCHQMFIYFVPEDWDDAEYEDEYSIYSDPGYYYRCQCSPDYYWMNRESGEWENQMPLTLDRCRFDAINVTENWEECSLKTWNRNYFLNVDDSKFSFFDHYLQYCMDNPRCQCYWPEISSVAKSIKEHPLFLFYKLLLQNHIDQNYQPLWDNLPDCLDQAKTLITHDFFYSQYHQTLLGVAEHLDQKMVIGKEIPEALSDLYSCIDQIQPEFLHLYNDCLKKHPHPKIYYEKGMMLFHLGDTEGALENVRSLMDYAQLNGKEELITSEMYMQEGHAYIDVISYDKAIQSLNQALKKDPLNKEALFYRSMAYFELGDFEQSLDDCLRYGVYKDVQQLQLIQDAEMASGLLAGIPQGIKEGFRDFIPSTLSSLHGLQRGLWSLVKDPVGVSKEFIQSVNSVMDALKNYVNETPLETMETELVQLLESWDKADSFERGKQFGHVFGKFGADIFAFQGVVKGVKAAKDLKKANTLLTLETLAASKENKAALIAAAKAQAAARASYLKEVKIHWPKQYKHLPIRTENYMTGYSPIFLEEKKLNTLVLKYKGTGEKMGPVSFGNAGYKEVINFGEIIGEWRPKDGFISLPTTRGTLHYDKNKMVHLVPARPENLIKAICKQEMKN